jgi:hypothetical protein
MERSRLYMVDKRVDDTKNAVDVVVADDMEAANMAAVESLHPVLDVVESGRVVAGLATVGFCISLHLVKRREHDESYRNVKMCMLCCFLHPARFVLGLLLMKRRSVLYKTLELLQ